jgi:hypothetical protein
VSSILKSFPQFTFDYILDGISYLNLTLLQASLPPYRGMDDERKAGSRKSCVKETKKRMNFKNANELFEWF